jgi:hypothetical protein
VKAPFVDGSLPLIFTPDAVVAGSYRLAATVARSSEVQFADIVLGATPVRQDFHFGAAPVGQLVEGWLDPSLATRGATVSVQVNGAIVRATPPLPDGSGRFVLYPVPVGIYELVVTTADRATAVVTGVPSAAASSTTINTDAFPINPPTSSRLGVFGQVKVGASGVDTGGVVRALQTLGTGPTVEVARDNARAVDGLYGMLLPIDAPLRAPYAAGAARLDFTRVPGTPGRYTLLATVARSTDVQTQEIVLDTNPVVQDFQFPAAP